MKRPGPTPVIYTVGHSTLPLAQFIALLQAHGVTRLVDVRSVPRSRRNPQFNRETLPGELQKAGVAYEHLAGLGGWRPVQPGSPNTAWREPAFQGYADYMQTPEFWVALRELLEKAREETVAIMCAEAVPWSCHRRMISDALVVAGAEVQHIMSGGRLAEHDLTPWVVVEGEKITYPGPAPEEEAAL